MDFELFDINDDDDELMLSIPLPESNNTQAEEQPTNYLPEFNCQGEDLLNSQFSSDSFIKNFRIFSNDFENMEDMSLTNYEFSPISLNSESTLIYVFNQNRMNIQMLIASIKNPMDTFHIKYYQLRRQVTLLYHLLCSSQNPLEWSKIEAHLLYLRNLLDSIANNDFLKSIYVANNIKGNEIDSPSYHGLHGFFEWRILDLILLQKNELMDQNCEENYKANFNDRFYRVLKELLEITLCLYRKKNSAELILKSPFSCNCIKECWLIMQILLSKYRTDDLNNFWIYFNDIIANIRNNLDKYSMESIDLCECSVWLLKGLIKLQFFKPNGDLVGPENTRVVENFVFLENVVEIFLNQSPPEDKTRLFLCNLIPILLEWWPPKVDTPMILWEYFHKKLNSSFFINGSAPNTLAVSCVSGKKYLEKIRMLLQNCNPDVHETSFTLFITILGGVIKKLFKCGQVNHCQKIFGRIYSKFTAAKFLALNETGLHNLVELFLTLALSCDFSEISSKLKDKFLSINLNKVTTANRQICIMKGHVALLILFSENSLDLTDYIKKLLDQMLSIKNDLNVSKVLSDGLGDIFDNIQNFSNGEHLLIDSWLPNYLQTCTSVEQDRAFEVIHTVFEKIQNISLNPTFYGIESLQNLVKTLNLHILPLIKQIFSTSLSNKLPVLAADFCLLTISNDLNFFQKNFKYFSESNCANKFFVIKFILILLNSEKVCLIDQNIIIQIWLRSLVLLSSNNEDVQSLTKLVANLSEFRFISNLNAEELEASKEPLCTFIAAVGKLYDNCENYNMKCEISDKFNLYVNGFEKWLLEKNGNLEIQMRFYSFIAIVFFNCPNIVYTKSKTTCFFHVAVTRFIIPTQIQIGKTPDNKTAQIVHKIWPVLVQGIGKLNFQNDQYIMKTLADLVVKWVPYFKISQNAKIVARPFINCLSSDNEAVSIFVFEKLTSVFLAMQRRQANPNACLVITIFQEVLSAFSNDESRVKIFLKSTFLAILEHLIMIDEIVPSRQLLLDLLKCLFQCSVFNNCPDIRGIILEHLRSITEKHLAYYTFFYFDLLTQITHICVEIIEDLMNFLFDQIKIVETKRGGTIDNRLRNCYTKLKGVITASKIKSKAN